MLLHLLLGAKDNLIEWKPGVIAKLLTKPVKNDLGRGAVQLRGAGDKQRVRPHEVLDGGFSALPVRTKFIGRLA